MSIEWFSTDGLIYRNWIGYEERLSQIDMIQDTYHAFSNNTILVAEAGTGLGKSLAYLSSGYLAAIKKKIHLVISTYTKNLQTHLGMALLFINIIIYGLIISKIKKN